MTSAAAAVVSGLVREHLSLLFLLCYSAVPVSAQNKAINDVLYVLPLVVVTIVIVGIAILVACIMYRAKRGYFCCLKPTPYRYPRSAVDDDSDSEASEEQDPPENLPSYQNNRPRVAPPDYRDAMQDPLVGNNSTTGTQNQPSSPSEVTETALTTPPASPTAIAPPPTASSPVPPLLPPPPPASQPAVSAPSSTAPPTKNQDTVPAQSQEPPATVEIEVEDGLDDVFGEDDRTPLNP